MAGKASLKGSGTGLRVVTAFLTMCGGELRYFPEEIFKEAYPSAPDSLKRCRTFFEFSLPNVNGDLQ
jgi:hypothetical protein